MKCPFCGSETATFTYTLYTSTWVDSAVQDDGTFVRGDSHDGTTTVNCISCSDCGDDMPVDHFEKHNDIQLRERKKIT